MLNTAARINVNERRMKTECRVRRSDQFSRVDFTYLRYIHMRWFVHLTAPTEFPHCGTKQHNSNCPHGTDAKSWHEILSS